MILCLNLKFCLIDTYPEAVELSKRCLETSDLSSDERLRKKPRRYADSDTDISVAEPAEPPLINLNSESVVKNKSSIKESRNTTANQDSNSWNFPSCSLSEKTFVENIKKVSTFADATSTPLRRSPRKKQANVYDDAAYGVNTSFYQDFTSALLQTSNNSAFSSETNLNESVHNTEEEATFINNSEQQSSESVGKMLYISFFMQLFLCYFYFLKK